MLKYRLLTAFLSVLAADQREVDSIPIHFTLKHIDVKDSFAIWPFVKHRQNILARKKHKLLPLSSDTSHRLIIFSSRSLPWEMSKTKNCNFKEGERKVNGSFLCWDKPSIKNECYLSTFPKYKTEIFKLSICICCNLPVCWSCLGIALVWAQKTYCFI